MLPSGNFRAKVYAGTDPLTGKRRYLVETAASVTSLKGLPCWSAQVIEMSTTTSGSGRRFHPHHCRP